MKPEDIESYVYAHINRWVKEGKGSDYVIMRLRKRFELTKKQAEKWFDNYIIDNL